MEAATTSAERRLQGEKAQRIVEAMRSSVARRGVAGSTFDHVAREAGVSRGLLHYYFGTKERLLSEVVRHDCDVRMALLDAQLDGAATPDDVLERLVASLEQLVDAEPELITLVFELFALSRRHDEIAAEFGELVRRMREQLADILRAKHDDGAVRLGADAEQVADVLFAMADGMALRMLAEPDRDWSATVTASVAAARPLLDAR
ncbi:MAG TPA: TetR/AcrR family transcriptional regulator [Solirubrobacteraceae bacterium]|jgi:AcrR family transcriptional regulator|nr:TetR/AcrR family transcriptional regulator [Solirubrobacteraceae bacterium]